ncbi:MAG: class I SAM-dependent methyltransferase [Methanobacterium sp.]
MVDEILKTKFNKGAKSYDRQRTIVIPNLDQLYNIITDLADSNITAPRILDLGAGTGLLTENIFNKYSRGYFTLIDISEEMLDIARKRFKNNLNFKYILGDYLKADFEDSFDIIISSLSIHHLEDNDKRIIYSKVYELLNDDGIFLNADQVLAPSPENEYIYQKNWWEKIETGTLNLDEKDVIIDRMKHDKPATLENNIIWLKNSGFTNVDVFYKYYNFCVLYAKKKL